jgi:uncharacterized protein
MVAEDLELHVPASLPWGGVLRGREGLLSVRATLPEHLALDASGDVSMLDAGDVAIICFDGTASGVRTGKPCVYRTMEVYRFRDGMVARIDMFYFDTAAMLDAIGPLPD